MDYFGIFFMVFYVLWIVVAPLLMAYFDVI